MTAYWFKPKRYGYGATPTTWQGWAVTFGAVAAILAASLTLRRSFEGDWGLAAMLGFDVIALIALAVVCRRKTDGEWRWRWGGE
jgi:uncharacterized membrane protein HdeD (DUF308 family)